MNGEFFVRWKPGEPRAGRIFDSLAGDHPAAAMPCLVCKHPLGDGRATQLYAIGPHDDESRDRHVEGRWYSAQAVLLHAACAHQVPDGLVDWLTAQPQLVLAAVELTDDEIEEFKAQFLAAQHRPPTLIDRPKPTVTRAQVRDAAHALFVWNNELDGEPRFVLNDVTQGVDREPYGALVDEVLHHLNIRVQDGGEVPGG